MEGTGTLKQEDQRERRRRKRGTGKVGSRSKGLELSTDILVMMMPKV